MAGFEKFSRLNFTRVLIVLAIAIGYTSTMPIGPEASEYLKHFGYEPSRIGIQLLFFFSGFLALASLRRRQSALKYLISKVLRNGPLLALFTLVAVGIIYPIFGTSSGSLVTDMAKLSRYAIETITCVNPGQKLPGLLDYSKYTCLIQGAVWTFRWGLIIHIGAALAWKLGLLSRRSLIVIYAIISTIGYAAAQFVYVHTNMESLYLPLMLLRLSYPFLIGMAVYAYRDRMPKSLGVKFSLLTGLGFLAAINATFLPWTPLIEISLTAFWGYAAYQLAFSTNQAFKWTEKCPHLALGFYLANWPAAQILLLLNPALSPAALIALSIPLALCLTVLTYVAVHGPTRDLLRNQLGGKIAIQPARL